MHSTTRTTIEKLNVLRERALHFGGLAYEKTAALAQEKLKGRSTAVSLVTTGILAAGFVGGTVSLVNAGSDPASDTAAVADAAARADAAERADRSSREAAAAPAPAEVPAAPAAPPAPPAPPPPPPAWVTPMDVPLSSCFGPRWGAEHKGLDFAGNAGTEIRSVGAGTVVAAGWLYTGYGISVVIDHGNGFYTHYAHASEALVSPGQWVAPGQPIALEGSTGDSTGPHLHFEVHQGWLWNQIEPASWLRGMGVPIGC